MEQEVERMSEPQSDDPIRGHDECFAKEYRPARIDSLREYDIRIKFLSIGCIIEVGCKSIPFATIQDGLEALSDYINNPHDSRKSWEKIINEAQ